MKKLMLILVLGSLTALASEKEKPRERTWGEFFSGRPRPTGDPIMDNFNSMNGAGSDLGAKAGTGAILLIGQGLAYAGAGIKAGAAAVAAKATVVGTAVIAAPATPWIISGVVVGGAGYKTYRHFNPTHKEQAASAELERKRQEDLEQTEITKCKRERAHSVKGLRDCVYQYRRSRTFTSSGLPTECEDHESRVSLHEDGDTEVVSMAKRFAQHAPMKTKETT